MSCRRRDSRLTRTLCVRKRVHALPAPLIPAYAPSRPIPHVPSLPPPPPTHV